MADGDERGIGSRGAGSSRKVSGKVIALGVLAVILVLFALLNTHEVGVDWLFDTVSAPMIVVIGVSALLGFAI
ncbi:MAG TPA: LapA family protein, partial [Acidimicrobiia bacterium]